MKNIKVNFIDGDYLFTTIKKCNFNTKKEPNLIGSLTSSN